MKNILRLFFVVITLVSTHAFCNTETNETTIGVLAFRPPAETMRAWQPLADTLNKAIPNKNFVIKALSYKELNEQVARGGLDFVFTNPEHYVALEVKHGVTRIATIVRAGPKGSRLKSFGGTIIARADNKDVESINDIKGKKIAAVSRESLGGYLAQAGVLYDADIDITNKKDILFTDMPHDKVVLAVRDKKADVGFIRSSVLEMMAKNGIIKLSDFKVINKQNFSAHPYAISTPLY
ncbi:MAG: phosphate/phosphite/phosphonate ABC transporter substrate-binding protein, partial [Campylobacterales bacterium]|nr:phosphate/phosphite/phosphonate ABC transporter substrate-binding protein [Campylobacterales bacterium]MDD3467967.1 phosphate/phosphite/phosphonate ABC transporter substrate-binding protein [Campylobacterales bacterium]